MFCAKCGAQLNGVTFCPNCGNPAVPATGAYQQPRPQVAPQPIYVQASPTNGLAVAGFVLSLLGWLGVLGFIFSLVALSQINNSGGRQGGRGLAIAGAIIGGFWLLMIFVFILSVA